MARRAEHLAEAQFALRSQFRIFGPGSNDAGIDLVWHHGLCFLNAEVPGKSAKFGFTQTKLRHARLFFRLVAIHCDIAVFVDDRARLLQPFINPLTADFRPDVREIGTEHGGTLDSRQAMAALTIQFGQELAAACQLGRLGQVGVVTCATRRLNEAGRQYRLFPSKRRFVSFSDFCGGTLAPVTDGAAPIANVVRNGRVRAKSSRHRSVREAGLRHPLMASGASVDDIHFGQPDLIDVGMVIGQQLLGVSAALCKSQVGAFVLLPLAAKVFEGRDCEDNQEHDTRSRKDQARAAS